MISLVMLILAGAPAPLLGARDAASSALPRSSTPDAPSSALPRSSTPDALLRELIAETAAKQVTAQDPAWHPDQRDCAGLIRFSYRAAFLRFDPARVSEGLWRDSSGKRLHFADAETLLWNSFVSLGRSEALVRTLRSGDVLAYRQDGNGAEPDFHLMLVVGEGASARIVYHPGEKGAAVRTGSLRSLLTEPPLEWRPVPQNTHFLGFFRFKEWSR